jgi:hypothetical protein
MTASIIQLPLEQKEACESTTTEYSSVDALVSAMLTHVQDLRKRISAVLLQDLSYESSDDPLRRKIGFCCPVTTKIFVISLTKLKTSPRANFFRSVDARKQLGRALWEGSFPIVPQEDIDD